MIKTILLIIFIVAFVIMFGGIAFGKFLKFNPTKNWISRKFRLYKIFKEKYYNVFDISIEEVEQLFHFVIELRCSNEKRVVYEYRNGYLVMYYPQGVLAQDRFIDEPYAIIRDGYAETSLCVGFNGDISKYQIRYKPHEITWVRIIKESNQSEKVPMTEEEQKKVIHAYRDFLIRSVL